jgi:hypothetical protein
VQVLPWLEANCSLAVARIQAGEEAVHRSKENRRLRYQGLPRNIHRYTTWVPISVADPGCLSRILILSCNQQQQKRRGEKLVVLPFLQPKFHKIET